MADTVTEQFELLCRRDWLVARLAAGAAERSELQDAGDVSRSTVDRGVGELEEAGLATVEDDTVRLTLYGQVVHEQFRESTSRLAGIDDASGVLERLPSDADLSTALFEAGERYDGAAARSRHETVVERADEIRGILLTLTLTDVEVYYEQALAGTGFRVVFAPGLTERLVTDVRDELATGLDQHGVSVREAADTPPYSLLLADVDDETHVCVCIQAADGIVEGVVESTHPDAVTWAEERFEGAWTDATPLGPP